MTKYCNLHRKGNTIYVVFKTEDDMDLYLENLEAFGVSREYRTTCWDGFYNTVAFDMDTEDQMDELVAHFAHFGYSVTNHDDEETDTISAR